MIFLVIEPYIEKPGVMVGYRAKVVYGPLTQAEQELAHDGRLLIFEIQQEEGTWEESDNGLDVLHFLTDADVEKVYR